MKRYRKYFRTSDGLSDYLFRFEEQSDRTWRAYIQRQPSYRGRATDAHSTHRLSDASGEYICWDHPLQTLDDAMRVAASWANNTQEYIRSGRRF